MQLTRHFTKVYLEERAPLAFLPFLHALDCVLLSDVRFALTGEETPATDGISQLQTESK